MVLDEILKCNGDNTHNLPHINKDGIIKTSGSLPKRIFASEEALEKATYYANLAIEQEIDDLATQLREWDEVDQLELQLQEWDEDDQEQQQAEEVLEWLEEEEVCDLAAFVEQNYGD